MIQFSCTQCGKAVAVGDEYAGSQGPCPFCGAPLTVPGVPPPELAPEMYRRTSPLRILLIVGGIGLVIIVAGIILFFGAAQPARQSAYEAAYRTTCKSNLKNIGQGLKIYAISNRGGLFPSLYSDPESSRYSKETWGSALKESDGYLLPGQDRVAAGGVPLTDLPPMADNLHCLWALVRDGSCNTKVFVCPSDAEATLDTATTVPKDWWDFQYLTDCSYSYQNQLGRNTRDSIDADVVLVADKSPGRADVADESPPGETDHSKWYTWNSPNHGYDGQNVLFADGHVEFLDTPNCGRRGNNIWIGEKWDETAAEWVPTGTDYDRYDQVIEDSRDSWLVP